MTETTLNTQTCLLALLLVGSACADIGAGSSADDRPGEVLPGDDGDGVIGDDGDDGAGVEDGGDPGESAPPTGPACPGAPLNPVTLEPICPPYDRPAVFFSPHPDDETLAMGGAIREHLAARRPVFIELMTHGTATAVRGTLADGGSDGWHPGTHVYDLSPGEIGDARVREFLDAAARLGVTGVYVSEFVDKELTPEQVGTRAGWWMQSGSLGLSLKGTYTGHPDHIAVWNGLVASGYPDVRGYSYADAYHDRVDSTAAWCDDKSFALDAYEIWDPAGGRYAIGYHSVGDTFAQVRADCHEYVVVP